MSAILLLGDPRKGRYCSHQNQSMASIRPTRSWNLLHAAQANHPIVAVPGSLPERKILEHSFIQESMTTILNWDVNFRRQSELSEICSSDLEIGGFYKTAALEVETPVSL
jgi:hypothetical protein